MARPDGNGKEKLKMIGIGVAAIIAIFVIISIVLFLRPGEAGPPPEEEEKPPPETEITENETTEENITEVCDDNCLYEKALDEKDLKYCEWMLNVSLEEACYAAIAYENLDACLKVKDEGIFSDCVMAHAESTGNMSICDHLEGDKELECRQILEPCYLYEGTEMRNCLALKNDDISYCEGDDKCLFNYSIEKNDILVCEDISGEGIRTACISVLEDRDRCAGLSSQQKKEYCWQLYAIHTDNKWVCTQIISESQYALECFSHFAVKTNDVNFCTADNLELDYLWKCYSAYSLGTGDITGCEKINTLARTNLFNCYFEYGKKYGDPTACDALYEFGMSDTCYVGTILNNTNLRLENCKDIRVKEWRNRCYTETAKLNNDVSICNNIDEKLERDACKSAYDTHIKNIEAAESE